MKSLQLSKEVINRFLSYSWPGNVRELKQLITELHVGNCERKILLKHLPNEIRTGLCQSNDILPLHEVERLYITRTMANFGLSIRKAAELFEVDRKTLQKKLRDYRD